MGILVILLPIFAVAVIVIAFTAILFFIIKGVSEWTSNNAKPRETIRVRVATKRQHTSGGAGDSSASTWYYATFENTSTGDRQEFKVNTTMYSGIADGDTGQLTYQGTRFINFVRERNVTPASQPSMLPEPQLRCSYCESPFAADQLKCPSCGASPR